MHENGRSQISSIQEILNNITNRLEILEQSTQIPKQPFEVFVVATEQVAAEAASTVFQNEPSFTSQSAQASLSAEASVDEASTYSFSQDIQASLGSLKSLLQRQHAPSSTTDLYFPCSSPRASAENVNLPPATLVLAALKKAAGKFNFLTCLTREH